MASAHRKRRIRSPNKDNTRENDILCVWWDMKSISLVNRKGVSLLHGNARNTNAVNHVTIMVLNMKDLLHPPYSSGFAPSDYQLFTSLPQFYSFIEKKVNDQ